MQTETHQNAGIQRQIEELLFDRQKFNSFVYRSIHEATEELERRQDNPLIDQYLSGLLPDGVPDALKNKKSVVLFRHIATSNYEICRFLLLTDSLEKLQPLILEYTEDKFTNRNESKYFLGRISLANGVNKRAEDLFEHHNIINFNDSNSRPISLVNTLWGQSLVDFHHELFFEDFPNHRGNVFDLSKWLHEQGGNAKGYYKAFLSLFLKHGILLENFLVGGKELSFTKDVILPAILEIETETGLRPLIVALEPTEIEDSKFWLSHPYKKKEVILKKMGGAGIKN